MATLASKVLALLVSSAVPSAATTFESDGEIAASATYNDFFGDAVGVSSKYLIVGASTDWCHMCLSNFGQGCHAATGIGGSVRMYDRFNASWAPFAGLPSIIDNAIFNGKHFGKFGSALAIDGDYVVVGSPHADGGSAFVYYRQSANRSTMQTALTNGDKDDRFGEAAAISGDYILVGSWKKDSAFVYKKNASSWLFHQRLHTNVGTTRFGYRVAMSGAYAAVSSVDSAGGYVNIYEFNGTYFELKTTLTSEAVIPGKSARYTRFGYALAMDRDVLVISASGSVTDVNLGGAIFVFRRSSNGDWAQEGDKVLPLEEKMMLFFGSVVSISGDWIVTGAASKGNHYNGIVHFIKFNGSAWNVESDALTKSSDVHLGWSVSISGTTAVIGSPPYDSYDSTKNKYPTGKAYVYIYSNGAWIEDPAEVGNSIPFNMTGYLDQFEEGVISGVRKGGGDCHEWRTQARCIELGQEACPGYGMTGGTYGYDVFVPTDDEDDAKRILQTGTYPYDGGVSFIESYPECKTNLKGTFMHNCGPAFVKVWKGTSLTSSTTTMTSEATSSTSTLAVSTTTVAGQVEVQQETISGTLTLSLGGASTQEQVETSAKKAIPAELQVDESAVQVTVNSARRLQQKTQGQKFRQLTTAWTVDFAVSILPSQLSDVQAKVADVKADSASLSMNMRAKLVEAGVPESDAIVTVNSFDAALQTTTTTTSVSSTVAATASTSVVASTSWTSSYNSTSSSETWEGITENNGVVAAGASSFGLAGAITYVLLSVVG